MSMSVIAKVPMLIVTTGATVDIDLCFSASGLVAEVTLKNPLFDECCASLVLVVTGANSGSRLRLAVAADKSGDLSVSSKIRFSVVFSRARARLTEVLEEARINEFACLRPRLRIRHSIVEV